MKAAIILVALGACTAAVYWGMGVLAPQVKQRHRLLFASSFVIGCAVLLITIDAIIGFAVADFVSDDIKSRLGTHPLLVIAIFFAIAGAIQFLWWYFVKNKGSFNWFLIVLTGIAPVLYYLFLYAATKDDLFSLTGSAAQCYVITRDAIKYFPYDPKSPRYDQVSGTKCQPVTPSLANRLAILSAKLKSKQPILPVDPETNDWFSGYTGEPMLWYGADDKGATQFFDLPGFHPKTGTPLEPVTKQLRLAWSADLAKQRQREAREQAAREEKEAKEAKLAEEKQKQASERSEREADQERIRAQFEEEAQIAKAAVERQASMREAIEEKLRQEREGKQTQVEQEPTRWVRCPPDGC
jgi:hypothetical protein